MPSLRVWLERLDAADQLEAVEAELLGRSSEPLGFEDKFTTVGLAVVSRKVVDTISRWQSH